MQGEKMSADAESAEEFCSMFQSFIEKENFSLDQIFNCDETGLYFRLLPDKTLASFFEKSPAGSKKSKERVTVSACANASGRIKLSLLLIGKSKDQDASETLRLSCFLYCMKVKKMLG
jgi:hypothetical protein